MGLCPHTLWGGCESFSATALQTSKAISNAGRWKRPIIAVYYPHLLGLSSKCSPDKPRFWN